MYSKKERDAAYALRLAEFLEREYALPGCTVVPAERGWYGETWRAAGGGEMLFVKLVADAEHARRYAKSFAVVRHMRDCGIDFISEPFPARDGALYKAFEDGILGVFRFVEGIHTEDYPLEDLMALLARTYRVPVADLDVPREDFAGNQPALAEASLRQLRAAVDAADCRESAGAKAKAALRAMLDARALWRRCAAGLERAASACRTDLSGFVLTSGDVGGNVILSRGRMVIIDWDDMRAAPPERDLWFYIQQPAQIALMERALAENGFHTRLRPERLAYYCFAGWFFYLREYARAILGGGQTGIAAAEGVGDFLAQDCFMQKCLAEAERLLDGV